jgi:hypothetical protein
MAKDSPFQSPDSGKDRILPSGNPERYLEKELRKKQTITQCNRIIKYIGGDKERFSILVKLFLQGEYRLTQHAAWPISHCVRSYPELVKPYFKKFIDHLCEKETGRAAKRNIVRLLQFVEIPKRYQGKLMNICFQLVTDPGEAIAVKAFSLTILENLSRDYPEILPELIMVIESRWAFETAAFHSRARKILNRLHNCPRFQI